MKEKRCLYFASFDTRYLFTRQKVHFTDEFLRDSFATYAYRNCPLKCFCLKVNEDSNRQMRRLHAYAENGFTPGVLAFIFPNSIFWNVTSGYLADWKLQHLFLFLFDIRELKQRGQPHQRGKTKGNKFKLAKQQLYTCITLFCTFLCRHSATTMWKCLISRFVEDMNARQRFSFSFCELRYSPLEVNSWKHRQQMTN